METQTITTGLTFPPSFFEDEVREGFLIPETMKRFWAGHLTVLSEVAAICERHGIRWFAVFGTLLGAVRHGGFVPWDDDVDIVMFRSDLERFLEVAEQELPEDLHVYNVQTQPEYDNLIVRVTSRFLEGNPLHRFQGSLYTASVDVFALENTHPSKEEEQKRMKRLRTACTAAAYFQPETAPDGSRITLAQKEPEKAEAAVRLAEETFGVRISRKENTFGELLRVIVSVFREAQDENSEEVILFMDGDVYYPMKREWFRETKQMPFEHLSLPVCGGFDEVLRVLYKDWHVVVRGGGGHNYPAYRRQEEHLIKKTGKNPFRYTFSKEDLFAERTPPLKVRAEQIARMLGQAQTQTETLIASGDTASAGQLLESCQTLAVTLGEMLEGAFPEEKEAVRLLEAYCEAVFVCYEAPGKETAQTVRECLEMALREMRQMFSARKEIVFLPVRASWWPAMEGAYRRALEEENTVVRVIPVPWYERDEKGGYGTRHDERDSYPGDVVLTMPEDYEIGRRCPDVIVFQFPYETLYRPVLLDPPYYASSLRNLTGKLIYIPCYEPDTPKEEDVVLRKTLRTLIEQPAVVFADQTVTGTEGMRSLYTEVLREIAGEDTAALWEEKIRVKEEF